MAKTFGWLGGDSLVLIVVFLIAALSLIATMDWATERTPRAYVTGSFIYPEFSAAPAGQYCCSPLQVAKAGGCPHNPVATVPLCVPAASGGCGSWVRC